MSFYKNKYILVEDYDNYHILYVNEFYYDYNSLYKWKFSAAALYTTHENDSYIKSGHQNLINKKPKVISEHSIPSIVSQYGMRYVGDIK